jgi:peptidoglycan/LPS O-acetylase OafA/YrhL
LSRLGVHEQVYPKPWLLYPILFCGYYLLAWATYRLVEKPYLTLRDNTLNRQNAAMLIAPSALLATYLVLFA